MLFRARRVRIPAPVDPRGWDVAVGRLRRAVDRYHDKVALMPDRRLRVELRALGAGLRAATEYTTTAGNDPAISHDPAMQRAVSRAATLCAHATEAALLARDASWHGQPRELTRCLDTVTTLISAVRDLSENCRIGA